LEESDGKLEQLFEAEAGAGPMSYHLPTEKAETTLEQLSHAYVHPSTGWAPLLKAETYVAACCCETEGYTDPEMESGVRPLSHRLLTAKVESLKL
jgi:hypothetical protein